MKAESLKCPNCAAPLPGFAPGTSQLDCDYCNTAIQLRDDGTAAKRVGLLEAPPPTAESTREPTEFEKAVAAYNAHVLSPAYTGGDLAATVRTAAKLLTYGSALTLFAAVFMGLFGLALPALVVMIIALLLWLSFSTLREFLVKPKPEWFVVRRDMLQRLEALAAGEGLAFTWPSDVHRDESVDLSAEREKRGRARASSVFVLLTPFAILACIAAFVWFKTRTPKVSTDRWVVAPSVLAATQARISRGTFAVCNAIEDACLAGLCRTHKLDQDDVRQPSSTDYPTLTRDPVCGHKSTVAIDRHAGRTAVERQFIGELFTPRIAGRCTLDRVNVAGAAADDSVSSELEATRHDFESLCQAVLDRAVAGCSTIKDAKLKGVCVDATR